MTTAKKERSRYLVLKYYTEESIPDQEIWKTISRVHFLLFGEYYANKAGLYLVDHYHKEKIFILRCAHNSVIQTRATIASITRFGQVPALVFSILTAGTIKRAKTYINNCNK